jgi:hypothetical protein
MVEDGEDDLVRRLREEDETACFEFIEMYADRAAVIIERFSGRKVSLRVLAEKSIEVLGMICRKVAATDAETRIDLAAEVDALAARRGLLCRRVRSS